MRIRAFSASASALVGLMLLASQAASARIPSRTETNFHHRAPPRGHATRSRIAERITPWTTPGTIPRTPLAQFAYSPIVGPLVGPIVGATVRPSAWQPAIVPEYGARADLSPAAWRVS